MLLSFFIVVIKMKSKDFLVMFVVCIIVISISGCAEEKEETPAPTTLPTTTTPTLPPTTTVAPTTTPPTTTPVPTTPSKNEVTGWKQVVSEGFNDKNNTYAVDGIEFNGYLYIGTIASPAGTMYTGSTKTGGDIWRSQDGVHWEQIGAPGLRNPNNLCINFTIFDNKLYVFAMNLADGAEIWASSDGENFTQIVSRGFGNKDNNSMYPLIYKDQLIVRTGNSKTGAEIWISQDGEHFEKVVDGGMGDSGNTSSSGSSVTFKDRLYIGTINPITGGGDLEDGRWYELGEGSR